MTMRDGLTMVARDDDAFARATPSSPFGDTFWHRVHSAVARVREAPETNDGGPDAGSVIFVRDLENGRARLTFELDPEGGQISELRAVLNRVSDPVSETWLYRWSAG